MSAIKLLTPLEVSTALQCSVKVVLGHARAGTLEGVKVGRLWRFTEAALARYVARSRFQPTPVPSSVPLKPRRIPRHPREAELQRPGASTFL